MHLFFVRHGMPNYQLDCLTEEGKAQAKAAAKRLSAVKFDKIFSSTSGRALETARYTADILGLPVEQLDFANEKYAWQEFSVPMERLGGRPDWCFHDKQVRKDFASKETAALGDEWYDSPAFQGEKFANAHFKSGIERINRGMDSFMEKIGYRLNKENRTFTAEKHVYDKVALFAHGGFSIAFLSYIFQLPYPVICTRFALLGLSCVTTFTLPNSGEGFIPTIINYNDDSHLYKEDLLDTLDVKIF